MSLFKPNLIIDKFNLFDIKGYASKGFNTILVDIDNCIDLPDSLQKGTKEAYDFLEDLKNNGFRVIIFSNNTKKRVKRFIDDKDYEYSYWSLKPLPFKYNRIIKKYHLDKSKVICFGDQLLTDILGANLVGLYSVYSKQLIEKDNIKTVLNRYFEKKIFKYILKEK